MHSFAFLLLMVIDLSGLNSPHFYERQRAFELACEHSIRELEEALGSPGLTVEQSSRLQSAIKLKEAQRTNAGLGQLISNRPITVPLPGWKSYSRLIGDSAETRRHFFLAYEKVEIRRNMQLEHDQRISVFYLCTRVDGFYDYKMADGNYRTLAIAILGSVEPNSGLYEIASGLTNSGYLKAEECRAMFEYCERCAANPEKAEKFWPERTSLLPQ